MASNEQPREKWGNKAEFVLSLIGLSVGLGNVWRFPAMVYANGGGAFVIAYIIINILVGLPGYFMELGLGQFTGHGPTCVFEMTPFWRGLGWAMTLVPLYLTLYYNVIIAWILHFLFASFRSKLIWNQCTNAWNDDSCIDRQTPIGVETRSIKNNVSIVYCNQTSSQTIEGCVSGVFATTQYFKKYVLNISDSFENFGTPSWSLVLCLLLAWVLVFACLLFGIKSSGKVVYVTATFPYLVLVILLIRGVTLEGSRSGILYYINPDFSKLLSLKTWCNATIQAFFSLGIGMGCLIMYASFNDFNNNFLRDAVIVTAADAFTGIMGGFTIFSILGFMSHANKIPIDQVVEAGTGLAFIIYPEVLSKMPVGPLFSILFFLMLFTLGIDSQFGMVKTVIKSFQDEFGIHEKYRILILAVYCGGMFLLGIPLCCPGGFYLFELINNYCSGFTLIINGLIEFIIIAYLYGFNNYMEDIRMMLKRRIGEYFWFVTWCFICPLSVIIILIYMCVNDEVPVVNGKPLPDWAVGLGWYIVVSILIPIPLFAIYKTYQAIKLRSTLKQPDMPLYLAILKHVHEPSEKWRPYEREHRVNRYEPKNSIVRDNLGFLDEKTNEMHRF